MTLRKKAPFTPLSCICKSTGIHFPQLREDCFSRKCGIWWRHTYIYVAFFAIYKYRILKPSTSLGTWIKRTRKLFFNILVSELRILQRTQVRNVKFKNSTPHNDPTLRSNIKGIFRVSKLQGIHLFYYLLDLRELANSNDMHKSLVGALFWKK